MMILPYTLHQHKGVLRANGNNKAGPNADSAQIGCKQMRSHSSMTISQKPGSQPDWKPLCQRGSNSIISSTRSVKNIEK